jgi:hypothetical protein
VIGMSDSDKLRDRATRLFALALKARDYGFSSADDLAELANEALAPSGRNGPARPRQCTSSRSGNAASAGRSTATAATATGATAVQEGIGTRLFPIEPKSDQGE